MYIHNIYNIYNMNTYVNIHIYVYMYVYIYIYIHRKGNKKPFLSSFLHFRIVNSYRKLINLFFRAMAPDPSYG